MTNNPVLILRTVVVSVFFYCISMSAFAQPEMNMDQLEAEVSAIFQRSCTAAGCHSGPVPQMNIDLTTEKFYASLVDEASAEAPAMKRVDPGHPENSYLVKKITGEEGIVGLPMPMTGDRLTNQEIATIETWISGLESVDMARKEATDPEVAYPFYGWKILNLPSTRMLEAGNMLFLIGHRFNPGLNTGYDSFYGLDGSGIIYISLGYAITDRLLVALGRSNSADNVELQARYGVAHQGGVNGWPIGASVQTSFNFVTQDLPNTARFAGERFKATAQLSLTRQVGDRTGLAVVPGVLFNPAEDVDGEPVLITMGLGGRYRFTRQMSVIGEWAPIVSGFTRTRTFGNDIRFDTWGGGLEIATAGHVFQIVVTNSVGLTSDQYLRGGDMDLFEGEMRLGFNIFRVLSW